MEFVSELGCTVRVAPTPFDHLNQRGAILSLKMEQPDDGRRVEVYLNPSDILDLEFMLHRWRTELADKWVNR